MSMPSTVAADVLPARSVHERSTDWSMPSLLSVSAGGDDATPERPSSQSHVTVTSVLFQPASLPAVRDDVRFGTVMSMLMPPNVAGEVLPAMSAHCAEAVRSTPSVSTVELTDSCSAPARSSAHVHATVTGVLFHPLSLAAVRDATSTDGPARSMLTPPCVSETALAARSAQVPVADSSRPSALIVSLTVVAAAPEPASSQIHVSATGPLFHPAAFGVVRDSNVIVGGVLSMLMPSSEPGVVFPARS